MKIFISILALMFCLNACAETSQYRFQRDGVNSQALSPYVLWQAYEGSASARGLSQPTILHMATVAQNLFATGQIGQKVTWVYDNTSGEIVIIDILRRSSVSCLQYGQKIVTSQEARRSQGIACIDQFKVWQVVKENPIDPPPHMF